MARIGKALVLALAMVLGLWGCAQGPGPNSGPTAAQLKQLENKCARLEVECQAVKAARDQANRQLTVLEEEAGLLRKTLEMHKSIIKERDALWLQVDARTVERDALQSRLDNFEQGLQNLLKQYKAMAPVVSPPLTAVSASAAPETRDLGKHPPLPTRSVSEGRPGEDGPR